MGEEHPFGHGRRGGTFFGFGVARGDRLSCFGGETIERFGIFLGDVSGGRVRVLSACVCGNELTQHSLAVVVDGHRLDALLFGKGQVGPVVGDEADGDVRLLELLVVPCCGQSDQAIVVVVGRLCRFSGVNGPSVMVMLLFCVCGVVWCGVGE